MIRRVVPSLGGSERVAPLQPLPAGPFGCILADPPWKFRTYGPHNNRKSPDRHYPTMTPDEIAALPVASVAAKDCALVMWVVGANLEEALGVGRAWGFAYKTDLFVWIKARDGYRPPLSMGYWTRKGAEIALLFSRGNPKPLAHNVEQVLFCPKGPHSAKPAQQYERIEQLVAGPYLELFARQSHPGWSAWGNETGKRDGLFAEVA